jgi:putative ABC transport system permease protein
MKWSLRHAKKQPLESLLVVVAVALGVGVIITVLTMLLSVGQQYRSVEQADYFRSLNVMGKAESSRRDGAPLTLIGSDMENLDWSTTLEEIAEFQRHLPPTMHAYVEMHWMGKTSLLPEGDTSEDESLDSWYYDPNQILIMGTLPEFFAFNGVTLKGGNFFIAEDVRNSNHVIVLPNVLAEDLFGEDDPLGQVVPLTAFDEGEAVEYTVIGVLDSPQEEEQDMSFGAQSRMAYAPITVSPYGGGEQSFMNISVGVDVGVDLALALEQVSSEARLIWGDQVSVTSSLAEFRESQSQMQRYALLIGLLASVGLVIAVINILNLMLARVLKRTKSIGLSLALGSSRQLVFRQFLLESIIPGLVGSLLGIVFSFGLGVVMDKALGAFFVANSLGTRILLGVAMGLVVSLLFGVYPAYLGSRTNPVDALRTD